MPESLLETTRRLSGLRGAFRQCLVDIIGEEATAEYEACRDEKLLQGVQEQYQVDLKIQNQKASEPTATPRDAAWLAKGAMKAAKALTMPETEESKARLAICQSCDQWTGRSCKLCGCFVKLKVKIPEEKCPAGKW